MNLIILSGHLGKDPETRATTGGSKVVSFTLATSDGFGDRKKTNWHSITCFGKTADAVAQYATKGRHVELSGRVEYSSWDDKKSGEKKYRTEIIADQVKFLGGKSKDEFNQENSYTEPTQETDDDLSAF